MSSKIRVLIVDDHPVVRLGLIQGLGLSADLAVIGEACDGMQALERYRMLRPDVVTMDLLLPDGDGVEAVTRIRAEFDSAKVLMLSMSVREEDVFRAAEAGAKGYVSKVSGLADLVGAIISVHLGGEYYSGDLAKKLTQRRLRAGLSQRELQVLRLVVEGLSNKEIVARMGLSEATVKLHVSNMLTKLAVTDRTQAAMAAIQRGIVHLGC
jgi:DNA-binding NarL/FixJ family response regulator